MSYVVGFIILFWIFYKYVFNRKPKPEFAPTSEELIKKYPFLTEEIEPNGYAYKKPEQTNIQINITHNHLHIHTTPEGNQKN